MKQRITLYCNGRPIETIKHIAEGLGHKAGDSISPDQLNEIAYALLDHAGKILDQKAKEMYGPDIFAGIEPASARRTGTLFHRRLLDLDETKSHSVSDETPPSK